jgi:hypothetical protein
MIENWFRIQCDACQQWFSSDDEPPGKHPSAAAEFRTAQIAMLSSRMHDWYIAGSMAFCGECASRSAGCADVASHIEDLRTGHLPDWSEARLCTTCRAWLVWALVPDQVP